MAFLYDPTQAATRPGMYVRFVDAAQQSLTPDAKRGVVAIPLVSYGTASADAVFEVKSIEEAETLFGAANVQSVKFAFEAGVEKVLVYTLKAIDGVTVTEKIAYDDMRVALDVYKFNAFAYDGIVTAAEQQDCVRWVEKSEEEGRHFTAVLGCTNASDDLDPALGNARSALVANKYVVNLINGIEIAGNSFTSAQYAPHIAGIVASNPLNKSITFKKLAVDDVTKRLTFTQAKDAIAAGSLALIHNGSYVRIEQGITTAKTKIRKERTRQVVAMDVSNLIAENVIGQINNDRDGQSFVVSMVKLYLEQYEGQGVLDDIAVKLDDTADNSADQMFISIGYTELDSVEKVFVTVAV